MRSKSIRNDRNDALIGVVIFLILTILTYHFEKTSTFLFISLSLLICFILITIILSLIKRP